MNRRALSAATVTAILLVPALAAAAPPRPFSSFDAQAKALLGSMTLDEKIGQMTQAEQHQLVDPADVGTYFLGSILSGGDSDPKTNSLQDWTDMYDRLQTSALKTRLRIPHPLRRRRGARPQQRAGGDRLPAQHRPGRDAQSRRWSRRSAASPRARCGPPASSGPSRPASPSSATSAGAATTRASRRTRRWWPSWARPR